MIVKTLDGTIYRTNHYPLAVESNCVNDWIEIYQVDNTIYLLNDWGQL